MEVIIKATADEVCLLAARLVAGLIQRKPAAVLGLAAGRTPAPLYAELVRMHREEGLDFSRVTTFNLDEFVGLDPADPRSFHLFMQENFFKHVNVPARRIHIPDGRAGDIPASCRRYEAAIEAAGGIDLQILGIGQDGHIAFNEPTSSLSSRTRIKTVTRHTARISRRWSAPAGTLPRHVITMGVGTIRDARRCLLLACGRAKAAAVARCVEGPVTAMAPASVLQLHPGTIVLVDRPAAARLKLREYYEDVYRHKPEWQRYE